MKHSTARLISFTVAAVFLIATVVVFLNLVRPAYEEAHELKGQKMSRENFYENQKTTLAAVKRIVEEYKGGGTPQAAVSLAFPQYKDEANVLNQLEAMAARNNLTIQNVSVSTPGARQSSARRGAASSTLVKPVGVISVQLRLAGTYPSMKSFISAIETNLRIMDITAMSVTPVGRSNQDFYTFDINFDTYYQNP